MIFMTIRRYKENFLRRKIRGRAKLKRISPDLPRLSVFRSNKYIYSQVIDCRKGLVLAAASDKQIKTKKKLTKKQKAELTGQLLASKALKNKIKKVVFDRGGCRFHGRVKALAEGAREKGLEF